MRSYLSMAFLATACIATGCIATGCMSQNERGDIVDQTYIHKYGVEVPPDYWTSVGNEGSIVTTRADGVVVMNTYSRGILDGESTYTFPHSERIDRREVYKNGQLEKETLYCFEGTPLQETQFVPSSPVRYVSKWYSTGSPKSHEMYEKSSLVNGEYFTLDNQKDSFVVDYEGTRMVRDDYGQLTSKDAIQQGQLTLSTTYHPNGTPKELIPYRRGTVEGLKRTFHPGGEPNTIEEWRDGKQEGTTLCFQNGEKFAQVPYVNGQRNGIEYRFKDEATLVQDITWVDDQMHGPSKTYLDGEVIKTDWYFKDAQKTKSEYDFLSNRPPLLK